MPYSSGMADTPTPEQREAHLAYLREYRTKNAKRIKQQKREYYEKNRPPPKAKPVPATPEERAAYQREYRAKNAERLKAKQQAYYQQNKDRIRARVEAYAQTNSDKIRERNSRYYAKKVAEAPELVKERARAYYEKTKEERSAYGRKQRLARQGWTLERFDECLEQQAGLCAICKREPKGILHADHNHTTGAPRELLCGACNRAIGLLYEDPERIRSALEYLERHKS